MKRFLVWGLVLVAALAACDRLGRSGGESTTAASGVGQDQLVVAKVGPASITRQEIEYAYKYLPPNAAPKVQEQGPGYVLDMMVEFELFYQEAIARGLDKDPEIADQYRKMTRQFFYQTLLSKEAPRSFDVTDDEVRQYFDQHLAEFKKESRAHVAQILVGDEATAQKVLQKAKGGAKFEDLVAEYSLDPNKQHNKGDMGWVEEGRMIPQFDQAIFAEGAGELIGPVKSELGYHVIQILERRDAGTPPFDEVKDQVKRRVEQTKADAWKEAFMAKLKEKFPVQTFPENLPKP